MISHSELISALAAEFPELRAELDDDTWKGLLHLEVACFARHTQRAIDDEDERTLKKCLLFADHAFRNADPDVKNALYVSYLEHLDFHDGRKNRQWALKHMPPALRTGHRDINRYLDELFGRENEQ